MKMIESIYRLCLLAFAFASAALSQSTNNNPIVDLGYAKFRGVRNTTYGLDNYFGIRYAAPPEGDLRWQAPQEIESHGNYSNSSIIDATTPGPQCVQGPTAWENGTSIGLLALLLGSSQLPTSEDCLLLNVLAPTSPKSKSLPVVVYIHGGGFVTGNAMSTDGSLFMQHAQGNIVWVSIQYRLGAYGFLNTKEFDGGRGVANAGLADQRLALKWVQQHIEAFGGDSSKITIWGGSAGGGSVADQLIYKGGEQTPPFRAAIAEYPWMQPYHDSSFLEQQYQVLLNASNCESLDCLRGLSESALENATIASYSIAYSARLYDYGDFFFGPSVDGNIIQNLPSVEFNEGHFSMVPLLTDHDAFEGILFTNFSITSFDESKEELQRSWDSPSSQFWNSLSTLYPLSDFRGGYFNDPFFTSLTFDLICVLAPLAIPNVDPALWQRQTINGDANINCPTYYFASAMDKHNISAYKFVFDAGVYVHAATSFVFFEQLTTVSQPVATALRDYFLSFIVDLDPNTFPSTANQSRINWPRYTERDHTILKVQDSSITPQKDADASSRCKFLNSQSAVVRS